MTHIIHKELSYYIIGKCMEVHNYLGPGFKEAIYKDALEFEFNQDLTYYEREKRYNVEYKGITLRHHYYADFVIRNKVILEVKAVSEMHSKFQSQALSYLKVSGKDLALLVNFGEKSLRYQRLVM